MAQTGIVVQLKGKTEPENRPFAKLDEEQQIAFGWANICVECDGSSVVDSQDHEIDPVDFEKAAYEFNLNFHHEAFGEDHEGAPKGRLVESVFFTPEKLEAMGLTKSSLPTSWWIGVKVDDADAWQRIKKGDHRMFSIQGTALMETY